MLIADMMRYENGAAGGGVDSRYFDQHPMMWGFSGGSGGFWLFGVLWLVTWILVIIALIALIRWLWKKGDKAK